MSREEVRRDINELLDKIPDNVLKEVFFFLKSVNDQASPEVELSEHLRKILLEDKELLERLGR